MTKKSKAKKAKPARKRKASTKHLAPLRAALKKRRLEKRRLNPPPPKPPPMPPEQFRELLDALELTVAGQNTAKALGVGVRQILRFANGTSPVPVTVGKLLKMYEEYGLPIDDEADNA